MPKGARVPKGPPKDVLLTVTQIAAASGLTVSRVKAVLTMRGARPRPVERSGVVRDGYELVDAFSVVRSGSGDIEDARLALVEADGRNKAALAAQNELTARQMAGELVDAEAMRETVAALVRIVDVELEVLPDRLDQAAPDRCASCQYPSASHREIASARSRIVGRVREIEGVDES